MTMTNLKFYHDYLTLIRGGAQGFAGKRFYVIFGAVLW